MKASALRRIVPGPSRLAVWVCACLLAGCAAWPMARVAPLAMFEIQTPEAHSPLHLSISPDGQEVVAWASAGGGLELWSRPLGSLTSQVLPGTASPRGGSTGFPFWSPDSSLIGYFGDGSLRVIGRRGGVARKLSSAPHAHGGTWSRRGVIVFAPTGDGPLYRIPASGGNATPATSLDPSRDEIGHRHPFFLPDGRHFIYVAVSRRDEYSGIWLASLDSSERRFLVASLRKAQFAAPGTLLYIQNETLMARPFDAKRLAFSGAPVPVVSAVAENPGNSVSAFSVSANAVLAYRTVKQTTPRQISPITVVVNWRELTGIRAVAAAGSAAMDSASNRLPEDRPVSFSTVTVTEGDDPHAYGFDIGLCYAAGSLSGNLSEYGGSVADPFSSVLENIYYDNATGDVSFEANIVAGKSWSSTLNEWVTVTKHVSVSGRIDKDEFRGTIVEAEKKEGRQEVRRRSR